MDKDPNRKTKQLSGKSKDYKNTENKVKEDKIQNKDPNYEQTARLRIITSEEIESTKKGISFKNKFKRKPLKASSKYKKKYIILYSIVILAFILAYQFVKVKDLNFKEAENQIENKLNMDNFQKGNDITLRKLYGINKNEVINYLSFAPKSNMMASEVLIVKSKPEYVNKIMGSILSRVESQSKSFKNYAPDQYKIINESELYKKGDEIYFISSSDISKVKEAIDASYK